MNPEWTKLYEAFAAKYEMGEKLISILKEECAPSTGVVFCPDHLGDTFWAGTYAGEYKKQHGYEKVLYITKDSYTKMLDLFPEIDMTMPMGDKEMDALKFYFYLRHQYTDGNIRLGSFPYFVMFQFPKVALQQEINESYQASDLAWEKILELSPKTPRNQIKIPETASLREWKEKYQNAVLLAPGAYSEEAVPVPFWEKLTARLLDRGLEVYVNYNGHDCDIKISGAEPLSSSVVDMIRFGECFRGFVGLRSGICDALAQTSLRMAVLFTIAPWKDTIELAEGEAGRHDLWQMGRKEGISCYEYLPQQEEILIERICEDIEK